jgi:hypothetical protein
VTTFKFQFLGLVADNAEDKKTEEGERDFKLKINMKNIVMNS